MNEELGSLRQRRRLDTYQEIHLAALDLIEEQGLKETTVQQIAARARVSPRTFFRYFSSKEQVALPGQQRMLHVIDTLDVADGDLSAVLRQIEAAAEYAISSQNDPELVEHRRIARLLASEPELQSAAASQERLLAGRLRARLQDQLPHEDPLTVLLIAELAVMLWRTSWDRWGELSAGGDIEDPLTLYRRTREKLRRIVG